MQRDNEPVMPEPLAYFLTWATYGTWLPGDDQGWVERGKGVRTPDPLLRRDAQARMSEDACLLDDRQRDVVHRTIVDHCRIRGWTLFALNCRTNHVHVVVAADRKPDEITRQFKAYSTRRLKQLDSQRRGSNIKPRERWWGQRASTRYINDQASLEDAIQYVVDAQDKPR